MSKKLIFRLSVQILLLAVPIHVLAGVMIATLNRQYREELITAYQNEVDLFYAATNEKLIQAKEGLLTLASDTYQELIQSGDSNAGQLLATQIFKRLSDICGNSMVDAACLKTPDRTIVSYDITDYGPADEQRIKAAVEAMDMGDKAGFSNAVIKIGDESFLMLRLQCADALYAVLTSTKLFLEQLDAPEQGGEVLLVSADGKSLAGETQTVNEKEYILSPEYDIGFCVAKQISDSDGAGEIPVVYRILSALFITCVLAVPVLGGWIYRDVIDPIHKVEGALQNIEKENLDYRITSVASTKDFQYLYDCFNRMAQRIRQLKIESYEKELEIAEAENTSVLLQVSPHMLLNSLSLIYSLSQSKDNLCIQKYVTHLMKYFRYVLRKNQRFVTVKEEMDFVASYLEIQRIRYPDSFTAVFQMDEDVEDVRIPTFLIENFVENSVKYARRQKGVIELITLIRREDDRLVISHLDTGNGMEPEILKKINDGEVIEDRIGKHIGIWNCRKRLRLYYGGKAEFHMTSTPGEGTQVWMSLPLLSEEEENEFVDRGR